MATLAETCYVSPNGATPLSICSYGQRRGPRESREKQMQGDILQQLTPKTKRAKFLPKPENVACRSILTSCRVGSAGTGSARGSNGGPNERRAWGVGREQVGCVAKTHRDAERCVIARLTHPIGSRPSLRGPGPARPDA